MLKRKSCSFFAGLLIVCVVAVACGGNSASEFGEANTIELGNGTMVARPTSTNASVSTFDPASDADPAADLATADTSDPAADTSATSDSSATADSFATDPDPADSSATDTGSPAPNNPSLAELSFASLTGEGQQTFSDHLDKPLVVNFFAAWCGPCRAELPEFESVYQQVRTEVNFLGISRDDEPSESLALLDDSNVTFPTGWDSNGNLFETLNLLGMPTTLFLTPDGVLQEQWTGALDANSLLSLISDRLL